MDFLTWNDCCSRRIACVNSLGSALKLEVASDIELMLTTDRGIWSLDRRAFEPPYSSPGFVGVGLVGREEKALYFDPVIAAALIESKYRLEDGESDHIVKGTILPLKPYEESLTIVKNALKAIDGYPIFALASLVWVDLSGNPLRIHDGFGDDIAELEGTLGEIYAEVRGSAYEPGTFGDFFQRRIEVYIQSEIG